MKGTVGPASRDALPGRHVLLAAGERESMKNRTAGCVANGVCDYVDVQNNGWPGGTG